MFLFHSNAFHFKIIYDSLLLSIPLRFLPFYYCFLKCKISNSIFQNVFDSHPLSMVEQHLVIWSSIAKFWVPMAYRKHNWTVAAQLKVKAVIMCSLDYRERIIDPLELLHLHLTILHSCWYEMDVLFALSSSMCYFLIVIVWYAIQAGCCGRPLSAVRTYV